MCGICGIIAEPGSSNTGASKLIHDIMSALFVATESRGVHATGYAAMDLTGGLEHFKAPILARDFIKTERWKKKKLPAFFLGHCRQATNGDPKENVNNHPFISRDKRLAFVHNGTVHGHKRIANEEKVSLISECDSEVILRVIEKASSVNAGIKDVFNTIFLPRHRDGACVMLDKKKACAYFFRNAMRPLSMARIPELNHAIVFASTERIITTAIRGVLGYAPSGIFTLKSARIYSVSYDKNMRPQIETQDIPHKRLNGNEYFSNRLPAPSRRGAARRFTIVGREEEQESLFPIGFDELPDTAPEAVVCPCGNIIYAWEGEQKVCPECIEWVLGPGEKPRKAVPKFVKVQCLRCEKVWEQRHDNKNGCFSCGSHLVKVVKAKDKPKKKKERLQASVWSCDGCAARFVGVKEPRKCYKCDSRKFTLDGSLEGAELPRHWRVKQCHDCKRKIPKSGPSRCPRCVELRRERRRKKKDA